MKKIVKTEFENEITTVVEHDEYGKIVNASVFEYEHEETPEQAYKRGHMLMQAALEAGYVVKRDGTRRSTDWMEGP